MSDFAKVERKVEEQLLISKFMGIENVFVHPRFGAYVAEDDQGYIDWVDIGIRRINYDRDWNELMKVVEKIESIENKHHGYFQVHIHSNSCDIQGTNLWKAIENLQEYGWVYMSDPNAILGTKFESTYYNVVAFIKWWNDYNGQKQNNNE
jgi:hypothetical protein